MTGAQYATQGHREEQRSQETQDRKDKFRWIKHQNHYWCFQDEKPEDVGLIPGLGRFHGKGNGNPLQSFFVHGKCHGQWNLAGYNPWD